MEDNFICKNYTNPLKMWHVRCDNSFNVFTDVWIQNFVEKYKIVKYILALENGEKTGKPHLQGAIWFDVDIKASKLYANIRAFLRSKAVIGKNRYSLTPARKPRSLAKYAKKVDNYLKTIDLCPKENHHFAFPLVRTNLTPQELDAVGSWVAVTETENHSDRINKLKKQLKEKVSNKYMGDAPVEKFLEIFDSLYKKIFKKNCTNRLLVHSIARDVGYITVRQYYRAIGLIDREGYLWDRYCPVPCASAYDDELSESGESLGEIEILPKNKIMKIKYGKAIIENQVENKIMNKYLIDLSKNKI